MNSFEIKEMKYLTQQCQHKHYFRRELWTTFYNFERVNPPCTVEIQSSKYRSGRHV